MFAYRLPLVRRAMLGMFICLALLGHGLHFLPGAFHSPGSSGGHTHFGVSAECPHGHCHEIVPSRRSDARTQLAAHESAVHATSQGTHAESSVGHECPVCALMSLAQLISLANELPMSLDYRKFVAAAPYTAVALPDTAVYSGRAPPVL